jgi:hypothetical protein
MGGKGCRGFFEACERLDFFKVLSLPFAGTMIILLCRRLASIYASGF